MGRAVGKNEVGRQQAENKLSRAAPLPCTCLGCETRRGPLVWTQRCFLPPRRPRKSIALLRIAGWPTGETLGRSPLLCGSAMSCCRSCLSDNVAGVPLGGGAGDSPFQSQSPAHQGLHPAGPALGRSVTVSNWLYGEGESWGDGIS